jgi:hypothetical protein
VAENEEKSPSIPWLPLISLIGVGSGVLLFFPQLTSSRPGGGDPQLAGNTFVKQTISARLWQDPLGVASADREKNEKQGEGKTQNYRKVHSVAHFQKILTSKCFAESANLPLIKSAIYPLEEQLRSAEQAEQVQILAVMVPGGPYLEDVERRLRSRRAVMEGLGMAGYDPEEDHEIGYVYIPWQPLEPDVAASARMLEKNRIQDEEGGLPIWSGIQAARHSRKEPDANGLLVPYEWCEPADFGTKNKRVVHVLVLWLIDDAFRDAPLARLADLISWFRLQRFNASQTFGSSLLPLFTVLGPDNSGTLHDMVMEAKDNPWNDKTRECLVTTHIYSSQAAAAESRLLSGMPGEGEPRVPLTRDCKNLIEQNVRRSQSDDGFCFDRTLLPDNLIAETLWHELERRGLNKKGDHVAIVSEEDTYYARALCSTFTDSKPVDMPALNLHSYTYLRGIDGKLPSDRKNDEETKNAAAPGEKNTQSSSHPSEQTEGLNQADDIRRLANQLRQLDNEVRRDSKGPASLKAVGLLGSDVYDKLELLKALRLVLPEATFFTNNLDARLAHPDEWNETHNLVVVSAFGLSLERHEYVPPFRDSGQTALFAATLKAMGEDAAIPQSPFIFEIGHNGPKELSIPAVENATIPELSYYLLRIGVFIAIGISLLVWTRFTSRFSLAPSKEGIENEELIRNEAAHAGVERTEAT